MRPAPELGIPETKPYIESIRGRWERKVSPRRRHNILQARFSIVLTAWAGDRGEVGSEYRFYLYEEGQKPSSLVPDVAYYSFERLRPEFGEAREKPTIAPDLVVEILSPGDRRKLLEEKIAMYLANGCRLVIVADSIAHTLEFYGEPYPDLTLDTEALFKNL